MRASQRSSRMVGVVSVALLVGLFVATGFLVHDSSSSSGTRRSKLPSLERSGPDQYTIWFVHPAWGLVKLVTKWHSAKGTGGRASLTVTDGSGVVRFSWRHEDFYWFGPAGRSPFADPNDDVRPPIDALGHIFLDFDPGRYNGVIVLVPTKTGFEDLQTLPPPDDYQTRFYCTSVVDVDHDGVYGVVAPKFCEDTTYRWRGTDYVKDA